MKQLILIAIVPLFLASCKQAGKPLTLSFNPELNKGYQFRLSKVTDHLEAKGSSSIDSLDIHFTLTTTSQDTSGSSMIMHLTKVYPRHFYAAGKKAQLIAAGAKQFELMEDFRMRRASVFAAITDDTINVFVANDGRVLQCVGYDKLVDKITEKSGISRREVGFALREHFEQAPIRDLFSSFLLYLPAGRPQKNSSWVNNTTLTALAPVKRSNMITVEDVTESRILLNVNSEISAGQPDDYYLRGKGTSAIAVEKGTGIPLSLDASEEIIIKTTAGDRRESRKSILHVIN